MVTPTPGQVLYRGSFWVDFAENPKEKPQLTALQGAETGGLIGSILGEFFWRAVRPPLPERWGFWVSHVVPASRHLCFGANPSRIRTVYSGRDVASPSVEGGRCRMPRPTPVALGWGFFVGGHSVSLENDALGKLCLRAGGRGAMASCFGGN